MATPKNNSLPEPSLPEPSLPEPWLRGILHGFDPVVGHLLRSSEHVREDMERAIGSLDTSLLWSTPAGMTPAGFHARHLAGSVDRLCMYLAGLRLTPVQLKAMEEEQTPGESAGELLSAIRKALDRYDRLISDLRPEEFGAIRQVGRERLKVTAIGLAIHIAEHAQRHTGQAISAAKLAK